MKIAIVVIAGLTISALIAISTFQLSKILINEIVKIITEAWSSPEQHLS